MISVSVRNGLVKGRKNIMKNKICKRIFISALAAVTVLTTVLPALPTSAAALEVNAGAVNFEQGNASLIINGNAGQPLVGKEFEIYRLFDAENAVGLESINYTFNDEYKSALQTIVGKSLEKDVADVTEYEVIDYIQSLNSYMVEGAHATQRYEKNSSDFRYFVEELRDELKAQGMEGDIITVNSADDNNCITISGLAYGYYIIDEITDVNETNSAASLCMVNTSNPTAEIYIKSDYPSVDKRVLEENNESGQERGIRMWTDAIDCEIGQRVYFSALSDVPDMSGYDTYYFAWHDAMDEALSFHPETVNITITDLENSYILDYKEYSVEDMPPESGLRFKVAIKDLKAIIDREFNVVDAFGERIYSQQIELSYSATLNDLAANKTGKPGIENDIRIEFSNNPDSNGTGSTGFSAWDTTACFTYKMNVTKENNHGRTLEGAKFKLYYDENCQHEVVLLETETGYTVINSDSYNNLQPSALSEEEEEENIMVSNNSGNFTIYGLDTGFYYLKEIEAPVGYRKLEKPIAFYIDAQFSAKRNHYVKGDGALDDLFNSFTSQARIIDFYGGEWEETEVDLATDLEDGSVNLTVVNYVGTKLPATGSSMTIILVVAGALCMSLALYAGKANKKR